MPSLNCCQSESGQRILCYAPHTCCQVTALTQHSLPYLHATVTKSDTGHIKLYQASLHLSASPKPATAYSIRPPCTCHKSGTGHSKLYQASLHPSASQKPATAYSTRPPCTCQQVRNRPQQTLPGLPAPVSKSETGHSKLYQASLHPSASQKPATAYSTRPPSTCQQVRHRPQHTLPGLSAPVSKSDTGHSILYQASLHLSASQKPATAYSTRPLCTCQQVRNRPQHTLPGLSAPVSKSDTGHSILYQASLHLSASQKPATAYSTRPLCTRQQVRNRPQHTLPGLSAPVSKSETGHSILYQASLHPSASQKPATAYSTRPLCTRQQVRHRPQHTLPGLSAPVSKSETGHSILYQASLHPSASQKPATAYSTRPPCTRQQVRNRPQHTLPGLSAPVSKSDTGHSILYQASLHLSASQKPATANSSSFPTLVSKSDTGHSILYQASLHLSASQTPATAYSTRPPCTCQQVRNRSQHTLPGLSAPVSKSETGHSILCQTSTYLLSSQKPVIAYFARPPCFCYLVRIQSQHTLPGLYAICHQVRNRSQLFLHTDI